jgi:hypothetical protein
LRNEFVEELIPDLASESRADRDVELGKRSRNRVREHEKVRKGEERRKSQGKRLGGFHSERKILVREEGTHEAIGALLSRCQAE